MFTRKSKERLISNQVFIGCPWSVVKKYEYAIQKLKSKYPLSYVLVGRNEKQDAEDLLEIIKEKLQKSSYAVFDASGGNPNVSLEYGFSEAKEIPRALYLNVHGASQKKGKDSPIIADLAGKKRNHYTQKASLVSLLSQNARNHPYAVRFDKFSKSEFRSSRKGAKKRFRTLALKIIHMLDEKISIRRADIVHELLADVSSYSEQETDKMIKKLHKAGLLISGQGPWANVSIK